MVIRALRAGLAALVGRRPSPRACCRLGCGYAAAPDDIVCRKHGGDPRSCGICGSVKCPGHRDRVLPCARCGSARCNCGRPWFELEVLRDAVAAHVHQRTHDWELAATYVEVNRHTGGTPADLKCPHGDECFVCNPLPLEGSQPS